jgi:ABC-2 type transport system ATP-binding protein
MRRRQQFVLLLVALTACDRRPTAPDGALPIPDRQRFAATAEGPPQPYTFGPDTRETEGPYTGQGIAGPLLSCEPASSEARSLVGYLESEVDRTLLDATLDLPAGAGPFPLVVIMHGWAGSKGGSRDIATLLVAEGYGVLRYSARGFGQSWGRVNLADVGIERRDLQSVINGVVAQPACGLNADAVAVTGASYGGAHSWLAAIQPDFQRDATSPPVRIRTVVPIAAWSDILYSLAPNGTPRHSVAPIGGLKLSYENAFYIGGRREPDNAPQPFYDNYPPYLTVWHSWFNGTEPTSVDPLGRQIVDGLAGYRSIWWQESFWNNAVANGLPIFQVQGFTDDLFPIEEAKRMLLALKSLDPAYPIASYFGDIGHPRASNKPGEVDYVLGLIRVWFAYYLKGEGEQPAFDIKAAITRPRDEPFDPANVMTVGSYAELATGSVAEEFAKPAVLVNPLTDPLAGFFWDPLVMEAARELRPYPVPPPPSAVVETSLASYEVPVGKLGHGSSLFIAGQPTVTLTASTPALRVQLNVRLFDIGPGGTKALITRGTYTLDTWSGLPLGIVQVAIPTYGNLWRAEVNHRLRLEISNLDSPYISPSKIPSVTTISNVRLELPVR